MSNWKRQYSLLPHKLVTGNGRLCLYFTFLPCLCTICFSIVTYKLGPPGGLSFSFSDEKHAFRSSFALSHVISQIL